MRKLARSVVAVPGVFVACLAGTASAQTAPVEYTPGFDPEQLQVSADPRSVALQDTAQTLRMKDYAVGLAMHLDGPPLDLCVHDAARPDEACTVAGDLVNSQFRTDLMALFGLGRFDVRATLPMVLHQSSDFAPAAGEPALASAGVGDLRLGGRARIWRGRGFGVAGDLSFTIPFGGNDFIGDAGTVVDPRLLADWGRGRVTVAASLGFRYRQKPAEISNLYVGDEVTWSAGAQYAITPDTLMVGLGLYGKLGVQANPTPEMGTSGALGPEERPAELLLTGRYFVTDSLAVDVGGGTALNAGYGAPPYRVLAGVRWMKLTRESGLPKDRDHDGIVDPDDRCPTKAEDVDGFEDLDGCPDADNDGDGIGDAADRCPVDAEDVDGFQDDDGCPDVDNDGDGVPDAADRCQGELEDVDGFQDDDGCPDADNDGDGLPDAADRCPVDAEDVDGFQDDDGCPDADNDGDGIADAADRCPLEAETFNGNEDEDGCPDGRATAVVTGEAVEISDRVYFDVDKARIKLRSYKILDTVVAVLKAHQDLLVRIEGHTSDEGTPEWNLALSQQRAEAVRAYLIDKGIDSARLVAVGFGYSRPLLDRKTEKARSKNRRVEFHVITDLSDTGNPPTLEGGR